MKKHGLLHAAVFVAALAVLPLSPAAAKEKSLGKFGAWHAYVSHDGGQTVCYMVTTKLVKSTAPKKRATPYVMITHRPIEASTDVVSYGAGIKLNSRRGTKAMIGKLTYGLFSVGDTAWSRDAMTDHKITRAIRTAKSLQMRSVPEKKNAKAIIDQFDMTGANNAYRAIGKACGISIK